MRCSHWWPHANERSTLSGLASASCERRSGGQTDALVAVRASRSVLTRERPRTPRAGGERQALQALVAARERAVNAKRAGLCQLRDLLITTPEPRRSELRPRLGCGD